jgi:hypothetical protein
MYGFVLAVHNIVRWVVLIAGILAALRALIGWFGKKEWTKQDRLFGIIFTSSVDVQLLFGILLYFVFSSWGVQAILDKGMGFVMGEAQYRFFAIEHVFYMVLALVFAHLGSALPKKVEDAVSKHKRAAIWFSLAVLLILAGIPWSRPLFPSL